MDRLAAVRKELLYSETVKHVLFPLNLKRSAVNKSRCLAVWDEFVPSRRPAIFPKRNLSSGKKKPSSSWRRNASTPAAEFPTGQPGRDLDSLSFDGCSPAVFQPKSRPDSLACSPVLCSTRPADFSFVTPKSKATVRRLPLVKMPVLCLESQSDCFSKSLDSERLGANVSKLGDNCPKEKDTARERRKSLIAVQLRRFCSEFVAFPEKTECDWDELDNFGPCDSQKKSISPPAPKKERGLSLSEVLEFKEPRTDENRCINLQRKPEFAVCKRPESFSVSDEQRIVVSNIQLVDSGSPSNESTQDSEKPAARKTGENRESSGQKSEYKETVSSKQRIFQFLVSDLLRAIEKIWRGTSTDFCVKPSDIVVNKTGKSSYKFLIKASAVLNAAGAREFQKQRKEKPTTALRSLARLAGELAAMTDCLSLADLVLEEGSSAGEDITAEFGRLIRESPT